MSAGGFIRRVRHFALFHDGKPVVPPPISTTPALSSCRRSELRLAHPAHGSLPVRQTPARDGNTRVRTWRKRGRRMAKTAPNCCSRVSRWRRTMVTAPKNPRRCRRGPHQPSRGIPPPATVAVDNHRHHIAGAQIHPQPRGDSVAAGVWLHSVAAVCRLG